MIKLYSWKDVDRHLHLNKNKWPESLKSIEVFPSGVTVYADDDNAINEITQYLETLFKANYNMDDNSIKLDIDNQELFVSFESDIYVNNHDLPLFKDVLYRQNTYSEKVPTKKNDSCPVIAFHSYKGGVGRTLSLLAFAKAWATVYENTDKSRLLIIDSDIEAPGLTWLCTEDKDDVFSYLDILALIQDHNDIDTIIDLACSKINEISISVDAQNKRVDHIFIPTYRYKEQFIDIYANPESILNGKDKEYILADVLSGICKRLDTAAVLIDLRAGISEYSSTLLFDPRVKKYLITSTSSQSIKGTKIVLEYLLKGLSVSKETDIPEIFLSMIPTTMYGNEKEEIKNDLFKCFETNLGDENVIEGIYDTFITELPFASELIHLTSLNQIFEQLKDRSMYLSILNLIKQNYANDLEINKKKPATNQKRKNFLRKIHELASSQITADSNNEFKILMTEPLKNLKSKYKNEMPFTVITGAKGSGKTFLFSELLKTKDWFSFLSSLDQREAVTKDGYFLPILAPKTITDLIPVIESCIDNLNSHVNCANASASVYIDNSHKLTNFLNTPHNETEWYLFWEELIVASISNKMNNIQDINDALSHENKRIVILVDGVEEILKNTAADNSQKVSVAVLCQDIINTFCAKYKNIGFVFFMRRDMVRDAININFAQFEQKNNSFELKWSMDEALRLALWLVKQACPELFEQIDITSATNEVINECLEEIWGKKLGKPASREANSSRWILAALSDFNGQLQARDIIRFLSHATESTGNETYSDRIIMPTEIRNAISNCSNKKIEEIKQEYSSLDPIFEKLKNIDSNAKFLPFTKESIDLSTQETKTLQQEGYLIIENDKYYLPEIVRFALGYKYQQGARPKVLSLLFNRR